ncbi:uncharacterized protein MYCFIDRAFT_179681 [Pseudocercospora fijiensis CIRAD86]|uniref:Uncharacterized protein n=1 Tax=Pseudocercospora fijiensis (strain CIRAD86) TaxID=383855 RepID=M2ZZ90_PSEFD|nr:uncharacterized protein MYCFIDRAFT_179681 [Pseudocercospora fijiensis CIRAD86]EME77476.1 hypothetical protein MYCFIDRAFT_179681 [Pseudocercospora fijiensis CIRAD86]
MENVDVSAKVVKSCRTADLQLYPTLLREFREGVLGLECYEFRCVSHSRNATLRAHTPTADVSPPRFDSPPLPPLHNRMARLKTTPSNVRFMDAAQKLASCHDAAGQIVASLDGPSVLDEYSAAWHSYADDVDAPVTSQLDSVIDSQHLDTLDHLVYTIIPEYAAKFMKTFALFGRDGMQSAKFIEALNTISQHQVTLSEALSALREGQNERLVLKKGFRVSRTKSWIPWDAEEYALPKICKDQDCSHCATLRRRAGNKKKRAANKTAVSARPLTGDSGDEIQVAPRKRAKPSMEGEKDAAASPADQNNEQASSAGGNNEQASPHVNDEDAHTDESDAGPSKDSADGGSHGECAESTLEGEEDGAASSIDGNDEGASPADEDGIGLPPSGENGEDASHAVHADDGTPPADENDTGASKDSSDGGQENRRREGCSHGCRRVMGLDCTIQHDSMQETAGNAISSGQFENIFQADFLHNGGMQSPLRPASRAADCSPAIEQPRGPMFAQPMDHCGYDSSDDDDDEHRIDSRHPDHDAYETFNGDRGSFLFYRAGAGAAKPGNTFSSHPSPRSDFTASSSPLPLPLPDFDSHLQTCGMYNHNQQLALVKPSRPATRRSVSQSSAKETANPRKRARTGSLADDTMSDGTSSESIAATIQAAFNLFSTAAAADACLPPAHASTVAQPSPPAAAVLRGTRDGDAHVFIVSSGIASGTSGWFLTTCRTGSDGSHYLSVCSHELAMEREDAESYTQRALEQVLQSINLDIESTTNEVHVMTNEVRVDVYSHDTWPYVLATAALLQLTKTINPDEGSSRVLAASVCADAMGSAARLANSLHETSPSEPCQEARSRNVERLLKTLPPVNPNVALDSPISEPSATSPILTQIEFSLQSHMLRWNTEIAAHVDAYTKHAEHLSTYIATTTEIRHTAVQWFHAVRDRDVAKDREQKDDAEKKLRDAQDILKTMNHDNSHRELIMGLVSDTTAQVDLVSGAPPRSNHQKALAYLRDDLACYNAGLQDELGRVQALRDKAERKQAEIELWVKSGTSTTPGSRDEGHGTSFGAEWHLMAMRSHTFAHVMVYVSTAQLLELLGILATSTGILVCGLSETRTFPLSSLSLDVVWGGWRVLRRMRFPVSRPPAYGREVRRKRAAADMFKNLRAVAFGVVVPGVCQIGDGEWGSGLLFHEGGGMVGMRDALYGFWCFVACYSMAVLQVLPFYVGVLHSPMICVSYWHGDWNQEIDEMIIISQGKQKLGCAGRPLLGPRVLFVDGLLGRCRFVHSNTCRGESLS